MIRNRILGLALMMVTVILSIEASAAVRYNVTDLGTLPGFDISRVWSISNS